MVTAQEIARKLAELNKATQPSIKQVGGKLKIVHAGKTYEIKQQRSTVIQEQVARFR